MEDLRSETDDRSAPRTAQADGAQASEAQDDGLGALARSILDAIDAEIAVLDAQGVITAVNESWRAFARANGAPTDYLHRNYLEMCAPHGGQGAEDAARAISGLRCVLHGESPTFALEYPCHGPDERRWFRMSVRRLDASGGAVVMHHDITERKERELAVVGMNEDLERRVRERTAALDRSNRELEAFTYAVAHDLKAPLRSMAGYAGILAASLAPSLAPRDRSYLDRIGRASEQMTETIDSLLEMTGLTRGELEFETVDLSHLARTICAGLAAAEPAREHQITIADGLTATGDLRLLRILMTNLLDNAWKFSRAKELVRLDVGETTARGRRAFFVRDQGSGFEMSYYAKLFQPFERLHGQDEFPGTGIGLATCQRIVHRHGGELWAESVVGQGATFFFTLGP